MLQINKHKLDYVDVINFRDTIMTDFKRLIEEGFMDWAVLRNTDVSDKYFRCSNSLNVGELKRYITLINEYYDVRMFEEHLMNLLD